MAIQTNRIDSSIRRTVPPLPVPILFQIGAIAKGESVRRSPFFQFF